MRFFHFDYSPKVLINSDCGWVETVYQKRFILQENGLYFFVDLPSKIRLNVFQRKTYRPEKINGIIFAFLAYRN